MLDHWGMRNTHSLQSFPGSLCPEVVAADRILRIGQIELNRGFLSFRFLHLNCILMLN